jgi:hypothetical protein
MARESPVASFEREKTAEKTSTGKELESIERGARALANSSSRISYEGTFENAFDKRLREKPRAHKDRKGDFPRAKVAPADGVGQARAGAGWRVAGCPRT